MAPEEQGAGGDPSLLVATLHTFLGLQGGEEGGAWGGNEPVSVTASQIREKPVKVRFSHLWIWKAGPGGRAALATRETVPGSAQRAPRMPAGVTGARRAQERPQAPSSPAT